MLEKNEWIIFCISRGKRRSHLEQFFEAKVEMMERDEAVSLRLGASF